MDMIQNSGQVRTALPLEPLQMSAKNAQSIILTSSDNRSHATSNGSSSINQIDDTLITSPIHATVENIVGELCETVSETIDNGKINEGYASQNNASEIVSDSISSSTTTQDGGSTYVNCSNNSNLNINRSSSTTNDNSNDPEVSTSASTTRENGIGGSTRADVDVSDDAKLIQTDEIGENDVAATATVFTATYAAAAASAVTLTTPRAASAASKPNAATAVKSSAVSATAADTGASASDTASDVDSAAALRDEDRPRSHEPTQLVDRYGFLVPKRKAGGGVDEPCGWDSNDEDDGDCGPPPPMTHQRALAAQPNSKAERKRLVRLENLKIAKWHAMLQNWKRVKPSRIKSRARKGVPDAFRGQVWPLLCGSNKRMAANPGVFDKLAQQAVDTPSTDTEQTKVQESIIRDIARTFPRHAIFHIQDGLGQRSLTRVLFAYSLYDKEVGYCQGMGFIVGMLLGYMSPESAFWMLVSLMHDDKYHMRRMFMPGMPGAQQVLFQYEALLKRFHPKLEAHMEAENIVPSMYATHWFITVFTYSFPFDTVVRVWDCFLSEGWKTVFRVSLALIALHKDKLMQCHFERVLMFFRGLPTKVQVDNLLDVAFKLKLKTEHLEDARLDFERSQHLGGGDMNTGAKAAGNDPRMTGAAQSNQPNKKKGVHSQLFNRKRKSKAAQRAVA